jgi:hypothetical protein
MLTAFQLAAFFWVKFSDFAERKFKMAKKGLLVVTFLQFFWKYWQIFLSDSSMQ